MATDAQIADAIAGRFGTLSQSWRAHNATRRGNFIADLTRAIVFDRDGGIEGGSLSCDNGRETIMQASLSLMVDQIPGGLTSLDHIALYEDRVIRAPSPRHVVYEGEERGYTAPPTPETVEFPLGLYLPSFSDVRYDDRGRPVVDVILHDLTAHLLRDLTEATYTVAASTGYFGAAATVLDLVDVRHSLPSTGFALPVAYNRGPDTPLREVLRDLSDGINYHVPWPNLSGIFISRQRIDPASESSVVHYSDSEHPRMLVDFTQHADEVEGVNQAVVVADDPRRSNLSPRYTGWQNADPTSPISTIAGGYAQPREMNMRSRPSTLALFDLTVAADVARYELRAAAGEARQVTITTLPDPRRAPRETYLVTQAGAVTAKKYRVLGWRRELRVGSLMTHELAVADPVSITAWSGS